MKLTVIEDLDGVRIARYHYEDPEGTTGENKLFASIDGENWREIDNYAPVYGLCGVTKINVNWATRR